MSVVDANNVNVATPPADGGTPPAEAPTAETPPAEPSGLPSEVNEQQTPWERAKAEGFLPDDYKEDPYELAKSWKNGQDFVKKANDEKSLVATTAADAAAAEATKAQLLDLVPEFIENKMELSDEIRDKAKALGASDADIKLAAYEFRDRMNANYAIAGGEAEYAQMMTDMGPTLGDEAKAAFDREVKGAQSEWAIKGMKADWDRMKAGDPVVTTTKRIEGRVPGNTGGVKGYATQAEMLKDAGYLRTGRGKVDTAAREQYTKRLAATDDKVIYNKR